MKKTILFLITVFIITISSCNKEDISPLNHKFTVENWGQKFPICSYNGMFMEYHSMENFSCKKGDVFTVDNNNLKSKYKVIIDNILVDSIWIEEGYHSHTTYTIN